MSSVVDVTAVDVTAADRRRTRALARVAPMPGKGGHGVVAVRDLPALTMIGAYPGHVYSSRRHVAHVRAGGSDGKYAIAFYKPDANGAARTDYVLDPGDGAGRLLPRFAGAVAPMANEPAPDAGPNLVWVWNLPRYRLEAWTARAVRRGEELTVCYGTGGGYPRSYRTSCVFRQAEVEPELHVVTRPRARPVPYSALGNAGVREAVRALRGAGRVTF